jgi:heat-inducible transcriptional repressor
VLQLTAIGELEKVIKRATRLLSQITKYTTAILSPSVQGSTLKSLQLIQATQTDLLVVVVTDTGLIKHVMVKIPKSITPEILVKINNMLNTKLRNRTIEDIDLSVISSIQSEMNGYEEVFNAIIPVLYESLKTDDSDVYLDGATNIFQYPEYSDMDKAKSFLSLIEQKDIMMDIFSENTGSISISIGKENKKDEVKKCSIIKASYKFGDRNLGTIGVIGPTRMNYPKVIAALKCCTETLNDILNTFNDE